MLKMVAFLDTSGIPMETELCLTSVLPTCPWQKSFCKARATASVDERLYRPGYCCRHTPLEEGYKNPGQDLSPTLKIHLGRRKDRKFCAGPLNEGKCIGMGSIQPLLQRGGEKASRCPTNVIDKAPVHGDVSSVILCKILCPPTVHVLAPFLGAHPIWNQAQLMGSTDRTRAPASSCSGARHRSSVQSR
ncbi:uncharacterized protein LOC135186333 isoform X5 [Pogoniulus pusillus]|uniref:uncharacterized protein LOC135186333 isoform X5 n=1 Tax=Pogoniulus pusillus TaxID=488313 RepID=UPI0030B99D5B